MSCISCQKVKTSHTCGICSEAVCRKCVLFLDETTFSFLSTIPDNLRQSFYCPACYDLHVGPALVSYNETLELARNVYFFFDTQRKPMLPSRQAKKPVQVQDCLDRDETVLRLAFQAVQQGFNSIIEGTVVSKKVRNSSYQKAIWAGSGIPAELDVDRLKWIDEHSF